MGKNELRGRIGWISRTGLLGAALALAVLPARAIDVTGVIATDEKRIEGVIRWKGIAKVYVVTTLAGKTEVEVEVQPAQVRSLVITEPAGLREAVKAVQEGKVQQAIPVLDKIAQDYAMLQWDEPATRWLAEAHLRNGSPAEAVKACERVIDRKPEAATTSELAPAYWQALLAAGRGSKLADLLDTAAKSPLPEVQARVYVMRGDMLRKQNDLKGALREGYLRAIVLCPAARAARAEAIQKAAATFEEAGQGPHAGRIRGVSAGGAAAAPAEGEEGAAEPGAGKAEPAMERELRYASGLVDLGLPDYAQIVMDQLSAKYPDARAALFRIKVDALASQGKFDLAEAEIAKMPSNSVEAMSALLVVSDRYYQFGKMAKAKQGYDRVLGAYPAPKGPPPELQKFYGESAYKFSQMLSTRSDFAGAVNALRCVLLSKPDPYQTRMIKTEMADLLLKVAAQAEGAARAAALKESFEFCKDVMWVQDDLFGRAVVIAAHGLKLAGKTAEARKHILDKLGTLQQIEDAIRAAVKDANPKATPAELDALTKTALRESPMAQCKYLLGTFHEDEARALAAQSGKEADAIAEFEKALGQFFTVVAKYPASSWASEACQHIDGISGFLNNTLGKKFVLPAGVDMGPVMASRYKEARALFQDNNFTEAATRYLQALNLAPAYSNSVYAVGDLAQCYLQDQNDRYAHAAVSYLVERFSRDDAQMNSAGNALLLVARAAEDLGQGPKARDFYVLFTDKFPDHERTPAVLLQLGDRALRVTNYVDAAPMYQRIVEKYNKPGVIYNDALNRLAACQAAMNDPSNAIQTLRTYFGVLPNGAEKVNALMRIADAYRQIGSWDVAGAAYGKVADALSQSGNPYSPTADDAKRNASAKERALFWNGFCYARMKLPAEKVPEFQTRAIDGYNAFLKEYPHSELSPSVLASLGTLLFLQNKPEEANKALDRLVKEYPDSEQAKNVQFVMVENLLELGRNEQAVLAFGKMVENAKAYSPQQFGRVGGKMLEAKQYVAAQKAFEQARAGSAPTPAGRAVWEPASLGLGQALVGAGQAAAAAAPIAELLKAYPKTALIVAANQTLGRAYAAAALAEKTPSARTNLFKQAITAQNNARQFFTESSQRLETDMEQAAIYTAMAEKGKALGSFQRVFDAGQAGDPRCAVFMEEAFVKMIPLFLETQRFQDALETIDGYLKQFPHGKYVVDARTWRSQLPGNVTSGGETSK